MRLYMYHIKVRSPADYLTVKNVFGSMEARNSKEVECILKRENEVIRVYTIIRVEDPVKN